MRAWDCVTFYIIHDLLGIFLFQDKVEQIALPFSETHKITSGTINNCRYCEHNIALSSTNYQTHFTDCITQIRFKKNIPYVLQHMPDGLPLQIWVMLLILFIHLFEFETEVYFDFKWL